MINEPTFWRIAGCGLTITSLYLFAVGVYQRVLGNTVMSRAAIFIAMGALCVGFGSLMVPAMGPQYLAVGTMIGACFVRSVRKNAVAAIHVNERCDR